MPSHHALQGQLVNRNVTIAGHRTSVRLEPSMWDGLREICYREKQTMHQVCSAIAERKPLGASLTAAIRVFVTAYYRAAATEDGHAKIGHGPGGPFAPRTYAPAIKWAPVSGAIAQALRDDPEHVVA